MSGSSVNNVVVADNCCENVYRMCHKIPSCTGFIDIKTSLLDSEVTIRLRDKFNHVYYQGALTDSKGYVLLDLSKLPLGLINQYAGQFSVSIIYKGAISMFKSKEGDLYDAIEFECSKATPLQDKSYIDISI